MNYEHCSLPCLGLHQREWVLVARGRLRQKQRCECELLGSGCYGSPSACSSECERRLQLKQLKCLALEAPSPVPGEAAVTPVRGCWWWLFNVHIAVVPEASHDGALLR